MAMLDVLEKELTSLNIFEGNLPPIVDAIADSIPARNIPRRMKIALSISELMLFASQLRCNIKHWNGSVIPINSIMFCIAKSGASKDSSVKAARKCFEEGYTLINTTRYADAVDRAIEKARQAGVDIPNRFTGYKDFYDAPNPLFVAISTSEGFIQHLNKLADDRFGAGFIYSGEIGAELTSSSNLPDTIKTLAELYDEGTKEVKVLKDRERQSKEVKHLPVSALFIGSQDNILYEDTVKRKFKTEFTSKLARRSCLIFINENIDQDIYLSLDALIKDERLYEDKAIVARKKVYDFIKGFTENYLEYPIEQLTFSEKARDLFLLYRRYNEELASTIDSMFPMTRLTRQHLQWKAFKLSGTFALMDYSNEITYEHYKGAIEFLELVNEDIYSFEKELVKEPYELFADYVRHYSVKGKYEMSLHDLRKAGFVSTKGTSLVGLKELITLVNSYDKDGLYKLQDNVIHFELIDKTDKILLSYVECKGSKSHRASKVSSGYICEEITFADLAEMLEGDYAYIPFKFRNGVRGKENIDSPCKWVVLDIDSAEITDEEAHVLLSDINHYVVRTSNAQNKNKFRVLLELDAQVDVPDYQWIQFIELIMKELGLVGNSGLSKAQIFFSYSNRKILSQLEGSPLEVKPFLETLIKPVVEQKKLTPGQMSALLEDPLHTFDKAFNAKEGEGGRKLIWACRYARELGASKDYCLNLIEQINSYWVKPFDPIRFENQIRRQIDRWQFSH